MNKFFKEQMAGSGCRIFNETEESFEIILASHMNADDLVFDCEQLLDGNFAVNPGISRSHFVVELRSW